jgi:hypothetical protein
MQKRDLRRRLRPAGDVISMKFSGLRRLAPLVIAAAAFTAATAAKADVQWTVTGTFDDGATLSGVFDINMYGQFSSFDLTTSSVAATPDHAAYPGFEYKLGGDGMQSWAAPTFVEFEIDYQTTLHLQFTDGLSTAVTDNPIVIGPSFECMGSYDCFDLQNGPTRYLTSGSAVARTVADDLGRGGGNPVPEPASWALMIAGFGMSGALLRARRGLRAA